MLILLCNKQQNDNKITLFIVYKNVTIRYALKYVWIDRKELGPLTAIYWSKGDNSNWFWLKIITIFLSIYQQVLCLTTLLDHLDETILTSAQTVFGEEPWSFYFWGLVQKVILFYF